MDPWKLVAALAIVVAGAVGAFAVYTVGWRDGSEAHSRVTVLRDGDVILRPEAATRCEVVTRGRSTESVLYTPQRWSAPGHLLPGRCPHLATVPRAGRAPVHLPLATIVRQAVGPEHQGRKPLPAEAHSPASHASTRVSKRDKAEWRARRVARALAGSSLFAPYVRVYVRTREAARVDNRLTLLARARNIRNMWNIGVVEPKNVPDAMEMFQMRWLNSELASSWSTWRSLLCAGPAGPGARAPSPPASDERAGPSCRQSSASDRRFARDRSASTPVHARRRRRERRS
jgi:hypothetical protein